MKPAARTDDLPDCESAPAGTGPAPQLTDGAPDGSGDVRVNGRKALRMGDGGVRHTPTCAGPTPYLAHKGSCTVLINGKPAHRTDDDVEHAGGLIAREGGSPDVLIGGPSGRVPAAGVRASACPVATCPRKTAGPPYCRNQSIARRRLQQAFQYTCSANSILAVIGRHDNPSPRARGDDERLYFSRFYQMDTTVELGSDRMRSPILRTGAEFESAVPDDYSGADDTKLAWNMPDFLSTLTGMSWSRVESGFDGASMMGYASRAPAPVGLNGFFHWITILGVQGPGVLVHDSWNGIVRFIHEECIPSGSSPPVPWNVHFGWNTYASTATVVRVA